MSTEEQTKEIVDAALAKQVTANGDLAQATAVALRGVLPYARQEVLSIHEVTAVMVMKWPPAKQLPAMSPSNVPTRCCVRSTSRTCRSAR